MPNAAIPYGFRKRQPNGDEKLSAAGIMFLDPEGRALFCRRKDSGQWSWPAGRVEQDEEPSEAARREALEEIGRLPGWDLAPLDRHTDEDGIDFTTFGQPVQSRFIPTLNDEHDDYLWAPLDQAPAPLHPGVARLLKQFFAEEAAEPEHEGSGAAEGLERALDAEPPNNQPDPELRDYSSGKIPKGELEGKNVTGDSALRLAFDRSVRSFDEDGRMRVGLTNISKANVCPYRGEEIPGWDPETKTHALGLDPEKTYMMYRDPDELRKSLPTWNGIQLLRKHVPVDVDDHKKYDIVGTTGTNAEFVDPYLRNSLVVWTKEGIELIESEECRELSCGYHYDPDMTPGMANGERYDGVMRNIRGNHVALVSEGRAGHDVLVADSVIEYQWKMLEDILERAWAA